ILELVFSVLLRAIFSLLSYPINDLQIIIIFSFRLSGYSNRLSILQLHFCFNLPFLQKPFFSCFALRFLSYQGLYPTAQNHFTSKAGS
ncbi:hypothetical protein BC829DRAFT_391777, partial [Chytridium lagenaria]